MALGFFQLREVCSAKGIALIFDEVFVGFRLAQGGAQQYFGVRADMVTYGKTLGGGLPVGVLCGDACWMQRFRSDRPADICFARGTFNSHPYVMGAMHEFLRKLETPAIQALYVDLDEKWDRRARELNQRFEAAELPVRVANFSTIWTVNYVQPSRYTWDVPILSSRAGHRVELGRHRSVDLQPGLHTRGPRCRGGPLRCRRETHARRWLVVGSGKR